MANALLNNVSHLDQTAEDKIVWSDILTHLRSFSINSRKAYETDLRQFFSYTRNKRLEDLRVEDLKFRHNDFVGYQTYLKNDHVPVYKNKSITRKIESIRSLFVSLNKNEYGLNLDALKLSALPDDSDPYAVLSFEDTEMMIELVLKQEKGKEKAALIRLASRTSMRKGSLMTLTWEQIRQDRNNRSVYLISLIGKGGKKSTKEISHIMYTQLLELKNPNCADNKVFHLDKKTITAMMEKLYKEMNIDERDNVKFHSLKKAGGQFVYDLTGDMGAVSDQLDHSSMDTARKSYTVRKKNIAGLAMDEHYAEDIFEQLSREEMLNLLNDTDSGFALKLKRQAQKIINAR